MTGIHPMCAIFLCCSLLSVAQGNDTSCPQGKAYESGTGTCMDCANLCSWGAEGLVSAKLCESNNCAEYRKNKQNGQKTKVELPPGDRDNLCQGEMKAIMPVHPSTLPLWLAVSIAVVVTSFLTAAITLLIVRYFARKGKYLFTKSKKGEQVDQNVSGRLITNSTSDEVGESV